MFFETVDLHAEGRTRVLDGENWQWLISKLWKSILLTWWMISLFIMLQRVTPPFLNHQQDLPLRSECPRIVATATWHVLTRRKLLSRMTDTTRRHSAAKCPVVVQVDRTTIGTESHQAATNRHG